VSKERRVVTILFSDVKGSTPMAERLDPEEFTEIMEGAFDVLIEPVTRYEGTLARLAGDQILAFFGAPIAHEDDAERACRAALDIIAGAQEYAARLEAERGISGFNVRVGIHTGLVVVGEVGSDLRVEYTAMGDAVNLASRMETAAEPGTILITEGTYRLIAPLFETEALGPIEVRGKAEPVSVYRVLSAKAAAGKPRGIAGLESPLVGREAEFSALQGALERLRAGMGGIITIVGEAGIGKSRLVAELRRAAAPLNVRWVEGRCLSYGGSIAYLPWLDMLHGLLGMSAEDPPLALRDAVRTWVQRLCPDHFDRVYPYLVRMMSLPLEPEVEAKLRGLDAEALKFLTIRAMEAVAESAAGESPVVLVCEDLHWADPTSLELLEQLLGLADRASLLLVCAFRPYSEHGCWAIRETIARLYRHRHTDLWLEPLSEADSEELVGNLLHVEALPRPLRRRILDHAEGNPFYVEEVIRSLIDSEAIVQDEATGYWQATQEVEDIAIPDTLQGVLMARIDRLEEEVRLVLQLASVIGRIFLYRALSAITCEETELNVYLQTLQREEMIRERARVPELEYIFKHHLTQQAAYNGLLRSKRRLYHRQVAEAWERLFPDRMDEQLGLLAHHWEQAGDRERAIDYLRRAGEQAAAQFANAEAVGYFSRALDLAPEEDLAGRFELLLARAKVYYVQGAREAQMQDLDAAEALAESLQEDQRRAEVAVRRAEFLFSGGDLPGAAATAQTAIGLAQTTQEVRLEVEGHIWWGQALDDLGDYEEARVQFVQALTLSRAAGLRQEEAFSLTRLGVVSAYQHDLEASKAYYEQARRVYREIGDRYGEAVNIPMRAVLLYEGDVDQARALTEEHLRLWREIGRRSGEGWALLVLGRIYRLLGDYDRGRCYYEQGLHILGDIGWSRGEGAALNELGLLSHLQGDDEKAVEHCQQALLVGQGSADRWVQAYALTFLGHALASLGRLDEATSVYDEALALRRQLREAHRANGALAGLARVSLAQGNLRGAQAHVDKILSYLETDMLVPSYEPFRVYLTCYHVLQANGAPRAEDILEEAHRLLQERAAKISDKEERRSYLESVAVNREIVREWTGREQGRETKPALPAG